MQHSSHDLARVDAVFEMATSRRCLAASLVGYFGETLEGRCGRCSACGRSSPLGELPVSEVEELSLEELERIQAVVAEKRPALSSPERLARFLCGIYSPAMMRFRLYGHKQWGMLDRLAYDDVLAIARAQ